MSDQGKTARGAMWRRVGLISTGLVLYAFITMHLVNLMLGLKSVAMMDAWAPWLTGIWSGQLSIVLLLCLVVHFGLALWQFYLRNTLRVPTYDLVQMAAGLLIVPLLAPHVTGSIAAGAIGAQVSYAYLLPFFWVDSPTDGLRQVALLGVAWLHGSIGIYTWLAARDDNRTWLRLFSPFAVLVPIVALLGYVEAGRQVVPVEMGGSGLALAEVQAAIDAFDPVSPERIQQVLATRAAVDAWLIWGTIFLAGSVMALRWLRVSALPRDNSVRIVFSDSRPSDVVGTPGLTLLEQARVHDVPHANLCRGRGRCGSCRVRVLSCETPLAPPDELERKTLARWQAGPGVRLACQIKPGRGRLEVERLVSPDYSDLHTTHEPVAGDVEPAE